MNACVRKNTRTCFETLSVFSVWSRDSVLTLNLLGGRINKSVGPTVINNDAKLGEHL